MPNIVPAVPLQLLREIASILGETKTSLFPFSEATGLVVAGMSSADLTAAETGGTAEALEDDFSPMMHPGGLHTYSFNPTGDHHLAGLDHGDYSHGNGTADTALSMGAVIIPNAIASNAIITKYDSAGGAEEYRWWINAGGKIALELHDASASASEIGAGDTTPTLHRPIFAVVTYDGTETAPSVLHYVNAEVDGDGSTTEAGAYIAMENTATPLLIGAGGVTATPTTEFHGRIGLPFQTGKALSAAEVRALWNIYRTLFDL